MDHSCNTLSSQLAGRGCLPYLCRGPGHQPPRPVSDRGRAVRAGDLQLQFVPVLTGLVLHIKTTWLFPYQHFLKVHGILVPDPRPEDIIIAVSSLRICSGTDHSAGQSGDDVPAANS